MAAGQTAVRAVRRNAIRGARWAITTRAHGLAAGKSITMAEVRAMRRMLDGYMSKPAFGADPQTRTEPVRVRFDGAQVRGEWVDRPDSGPRTGPVILYIHGGAFVGGSTLSHRGLVSEIAERTGRPVFSVEYRLAPEYPFPAAADDVLRAYKWLLDSGLSAGEIVVMGDSAGGHLALGLSPRAHRAGLAVPSAVVALSPVVDPTMDRSFGWARDNRTDLPDYFAKAGGTIMKRYWSTAGQNHREVVLTEDDLSIMPPTLIQASDSELLTDDARAYAEQLKTTGGDVTLQLYPRRVHVFQVAHRISGEASKALDELAAFVKVH